MTKKFEKKLEDYSQKIEALKAFESKRLRQKKRIKRLIFLTSLFLILLLFNKDRWLSVIKTYWQQLH